jgi:hypothetical protein
MRPYRLTFHIPGRRLAMPKRKVVPFVRESEKTCWNLYGLQILAPERFQRVVQEVINGRYLLFRTELTTRFWS